MDKRQLRSRLLQQHLKSPPSSGATTARTASCFSIQKIPLVNNNVDICLFDGDCLSFDSGRIVNHPQKALMFGELKGGIDSAGADEH